jgi:hypothetical protein
MKRNSFKLLLIAVLFFTLNASGQKDSSGIYKSAFQENHKLHDAIGAQFSSDMELYDYDSFHKLYKLNRIIKNNIH